MEKISIKDLSVHAYQAEEDGTLLHYDIYYVGMKVGECIRIKNIVKLHQEEGIFEYEDTIKEDLICFMNKNCNEKDYYSKANNMGYVKCM